MHGDIIKILLLRVTKKNGHRTKVTNILVGKTEVKRPLGRSTRRYEDNINMNI
jgi:hypothetical protein